MPVSRTPIRLDNVYFDNMVIQIYPSEHQLNKANTSDTKAAFLDLHLSISNDIISTKIYNKPDNFSFIYCWALIFALSPCYILIYMF